MVLTLGKNKSGGTQAKRKKELKQWSRDEIARPIQEHKRYVASLRSQLSRFERKYELSSEVLENAIRTGRIKDTLEVGKWLTIYRVYTLLLTPSLPKRRKKDTAGTP